LVKCDFVLSFIDGKMGLFVDRKMVLSTYWWPSYEQTIYNYSVYVIPVIILYCRIQLYGLVSPVSTTMIVYEFYSRI